MQGLFIGNVNLCETLINRIIQQGHGTETPNGGGLVEGNKHEGSMVLELLKLF